MARELYDLDWWIRQSLRDRSPEATFDLMKEALAQNAVEMGFIEHADGSWRFAGQFTWGPGVTVVEQVPVEVWQRVASGLSDHSRPHQPNSSR